MAKCNFPLFSFSASGKLKNRLTFSQRSSGQQVRFQRAQKDVSTSAREEQRDLYKTAVAAWNALSYSAKLVYVSRAAGLGFTGYNLFVKENIVVNVSGVYGIRIYAVGLYGFNS